MKSTNPFSSKTFTVKHKNKLFDKLKEAPLKESFSKREILINYIAELVPKLMTPDEKYLSKRPFIRKTNSFYLRFDLFGFTIEGATVFDFSINSIPGIPIESPKAGRSIGIKIDLSERILDNCSEDEINTVKELLENVWLAAKEVKDFGVASGIAPLKRFDNPFPKIRTIGQLEKFNKDYYNLLLELFPSEFMIKTPEKSSLEIALDKLKYSLGY